MSDARRILQFTDPHLLADRAGDMRGVRTLDSLMGTLQAARAEHYPADIILVTGDIAQDESPETYELFKECLTTMGLPVYCLPGNHDAPHHMRKLLAQPPFQYCGSADLGSWLVILLDTHVDGDAGGHIAPEDLKALDLELAANRDKHVLVTLHHHPVSSGSRWLDTVALRNAADLWRVLDRHDHVRCLLWGHVHQAFEERRDGMVLLSTPSTCRQFAPNHKVFGLDDRPPAYRWLDLHADGTVVTAVNWCNELAVTEN